MHTFHNDSLNIRGTDRFCVFLIPSVELWLDVSTEYAHLI